METFALIAAGLGIGLILGAVLGYFIADSRARARAAAEMQNFVQQQSAQATDKAGAGAFSPRANAASGHSPRERPH
jgi:hypothetical protein